MSPKLFVLVVLSLTLAIGIYINRAYASVFQGILGPIPMERKYTVGEKSDKKPLKYVVLGDSLSYGVGANLMEQTFPYIVASQLAQKSQTQIEVVNLGIPGATILGVVDQELKEAL